MRQKRVASVPRAVLLNGLKHRPKTGQSKNHAKQKITYHYLKIRRPFQVENRPAAGCRRGKQ